MSKIPTYWDAICFIGFFPFPTSDTNINNIISGKKVRTENFCTTLFPTDGVSQARLPGAWEPECAKSYPLEITICLALNW